MATPPLEHGEHYDWDSDWQLYKVVGYDYSRQCWEFRRWMPRGWTPPDSTPAQPSQPAAPTQGRRSSESRSETLYHSRSDSHQTGSSRYAQPARAADATAAHGRNQSHHYAFNPNQQSSDSTGYQQPHYNSHSSASHTSTYPIQSPPRFPRGTGPYVQGTYQGPETQTSHYETVDPSYYVRTRSFFVEGRVFAVILSEAAGETSRNPTDYNSSISTVRYAGHRVHTQTRRFVVVHQKREFCFACPIFTYSGRATTKPGAVPSEHGIIYSTGSAPQLVQGESGITKLSIGVNMAAGVSPLQQASRIYYGIHHPIQYNVKVKDMGMVPAEHIPFLRGNWNEENEGMLQSVISGDNAGQQ